MNETHRTNLIHATTTHDMSAYCTPDVQGHCVTCSDEARSYTVVRVDAEHGLAEVSVEKPDEPGKTTEEIDITLVDDLVPGNIVLVHGGVAIALLGEENDE